MLKQRILTALVLVPIAIWGIFFLPFASFSLFVGVVVALGAWEWANLSGVSNQVARVAYAAGVSALLWLIYDQPTLPVLLIGLAWWIFALVFVLNFPKLKSAWANSVSSLIIGLMVLVPFWKGLLLIKQMEHSEFVLLYLCFMVWGADVGAYFAGRKFGKAKLAPRVSPGKSWAGFWGGMVSSCIIGLGMAVYAGMATQAIVILMLVTVVTVAVSVLGDLSESMFKRHTGIKDSSQLLPGHGGVMDRIDSLTAAGPVFALLLLLTGISF